METLKAAVPSFVQKSKFKPVSLHARYELGADVIEQREGLKWQCKVVDAVFAYIDTVPAAFEQILLAHELLAQAGISIVDEAPDPTRWLERLRASAGRVAEVAAASKEPLKTIRATLQACFEDLGQADCAMSELSRYSQKVQVLTSDSLDRQERSNGASENPAVPARVKRNRVKMQHWADQACLRQARAGDLVQACMARQSSLIEITQDLVCSVVAGVGAVSGCNPSVQKIAAESPISPSAEPLVFNFHITPSAPPSTASQSPAHSDEQVPFDASPASAVQHLSCTSAVVPCSASPVEASALRPLRDELGAGADASRISCLSDELEAYGEGTLSLARVEGDVAEAPSIAHTLSPREQPSTLLVPVPLDSRGHHAEFIATGSEDLRNASGIADELHACGAGVGSLGPGMHDPAAVAALPTPCAAPARPRGGTGLLAALTDEAVNSTLGESVLAVGVGTPALPAPRQLARYSPSPRICEPSPRVDEDTCAALLPSGACGSIGGKAVVRAQPTPHVLASSAPSPVVLCVSASAVPGGEVTVAEKKASLTTHAESTPTAQKLWSTPETHTSMQSMRSCRARQGGA